MYQRRSGSPEAGTGFTLVELIVVIVLIGIMASVVSTPLIQGLMARQEVATDLEAIGKLRYATERVAREVRQVQFSGTGFLLTPLDTLSGNSSTGICFTRLGGINGTPATTVAVRVNSGLGTITYDLPTNCASPSANPQTLANGANANSLSFQYFGFIDPNLNNGVGGLQQVQVSDPNFASDVNVVVIAMTLATSGGAQLTERTTVLLENGVWGPPS